MRLIDGKALNTAVAVFMAENAYLNMTALDALKMVSGWIAEAPTIDAVPVVHGHPVYHNRPVHYEHYEMVQQTENGEPLYKRQYYTLQDNPVAYCSECGKRLCSRFTSYCPNCGADMREAAAQCETILTQNPAKDADLGTNNEH